MRGGGGEGKEAGANQPSIEEVVASAAVGRHRRPGLRPAGPPQPFPTARATP